MEKFSRCHSASADHTVSTVFSKQFFRGLVPNWLFIFLNHVHFHVKLSFDLVTIMFIQFRILEISETILLNNLLRFIIF